MVTLSQLFDRFRPSIVFGAIVGLSLNMFLRFSSLAGNVYVSKLLIFDSRFKGLVIVPFFALLGVLIQWRKGWR